MFQKPAFGSTTANFGSFNSGTSTASPFGGFKPTTGTSAFGAPPAFGAATSTQPTTGGGLFGTTNTTGGLFGGSTASTSTAGFGASTSGFGFGAAQPATGGLFGNTSTVGGGLFGATHNQTAFGAKPTGFGFGGTTTTGATAGGSLFGSTPSTGTGLFGQQTNTLGGGGLFSTNTAGAFGQQQQQQSGTAHVKYNPVVGTDVVVKSGTSQSVNIKHHCITCMKEYENKSLEELRLEDYVAGRKGNTTGVFGGFQQQPENKPLFGNTSFGQPATTSAPSVFGGGSLGGAGFAQQPSSFSFANNAQTTNTTGLFGANKPAFGAPQPTGGTGLFGATTTQAPTFGTNTSTFGFGATTQTQPPPGGLLFGGSKAGAAPFGAPGASAGFGGFGAAGVFGAKTQAPSFGTQAPAFGSMTTGAFGTTTSSAGGLFGGNQSFGKPTTAPTFGFNTQQSGLGTGLGGGLGTNQFQAKPAAPAFGQLGATMFPQQAQNTFKTGLDSGLGGGMFGNNSSMGGMGMGGMLNNPAAGMNNSLSGSSAGGNVHEQILTLAARPYGDSPLFKDLLPDSSTTAEDVLKPTNPAAVKAVLDSSSSAAYRVSSPTALRLTVTPRTTRDDKKSLFDGLEESDASLEDKLCLKPSRKRLVLRPNQRANDSHHDSVDHTNDTGRSLEEHRQSNGGLPSREMASEQPNMDEVDRRQDEYVSLKNVSAGRQADISSGSDRHGSWLSSSKLPWNDKEKPLDGESTPRLYPNLDKDIQTQVSERRASWLTTKPLRPPLVSNPDSAENSVRELAVRSDRSHDKENIDTLSMSEEEHVSPREAPPHPTGVKLTRPGYYTIPSLDEMIAYIRPDGSCPVPHLTIGRKNYGNVFYDCEIDVAGMDLDSLVHFLNKEVIVYPEESAKPPLGTGLNRRAIVTLDRVWPRDKTEKRAITSPDRLLKMEYESKLRRVCDKHNTKFIEYRPQTGSWVFRVEHFSKYGLTDSDEEEDVPQLMKRQLVVQAVQGTAAPAPKQPVTAPSAGLGGLGSSAGLVPEDNLFAMQQTSLNLLNGAAKAFEMDTTEDNNESQSLYLDNKAYGVKSPTSELARLEHRQSHNVQLMKASLYADTEMEDDVSVSTGDQLVPVSMPLLSVPSHPPSVTREDQQISEIEAPPTEEIPMRPLIVRPHTIVLKYHRKVPPFRQTIAVSEEEHVSPREAPPHPTGVKLTRPGYYTIPSLDEMIAYIRPDGSCPVPHLTIGRKNYGNVFYDCEIDVAGMDLDSLVHFLNKEVIVYPEESAKPPLGTGLNRRAIVTLDRVWPRDKTEKRAITSPDRLLKMEYESKLRRVCDKHNTKFIEYRPQTGSWVFRVEHFSKYGLTDSDEEEDVPQLMKRQLVVQAVQGTAAPAPKQPVTAPSAGLGGLGSSAGLVPEDNLFAMQQTSLNLLNGAAKAFEMDTTEDNNESQSLYLDNKAYGVKSPTSELARLEHRQSHNVQLMKASLYADTEMEDDVSVSTGDQLVPVSMPLLSVPSHPPSVTREDQQISEIEAPPTEEIPMRPLIVRPHTIVLKYHRKVPPFRQTIAGRLDAAYISDMSVCRARHSRVGFGPAGALTFTTSYDSVNDLPRSAELSELGKYVRGRSQNDWSEPLLVRMALGQPDKDDGMLEVLKKHLATLLEHSTFTQTEENQCARLSLSQSPSDRREVLTQYLRDSADNQTRYKFGVSGAYCYEVWRLCDALWGADLENDGIPGTDPLSIVNRHRKLLDWLKTAVAEATDEDLSKPTLGENEDEADGHSARIWTLLLGGRILEACKVAKEHGDLNMAILIAQAAGDPTFRSLITRQLSLWRECGADTLISPHRWAALQLVAGQSAPRDKLRETDWLRALHATARYLCPHIPSLEQVTRTYEGFFTNSNQDGDDDVDLSLIENDEMCMRLPLPPYVTHYDVTVVNNGKQRRVLDLRYELIRARAFNSRPKLRPAAYTPDPMDYSLCFLLGTWFGNPSTESITGIADQLEASGAWHLAVQALSYHPEDTARGHLIRGVLSRHAPARADTADLRARLELIRRLNVPEQWLLLAQAHRAKYERLPSLEAEHLVGAGQWNAAHKVLLEELLPEAVLADDLQSIAPILEKMNEAAQRHEVSGWENGGQALYCYLHVCDEIRGLVSSAEAQRDRTSVHARLEALRPKVAAACRALGGLQPKSVGVRFARTEMGARLVQCTLAAQEPPAHLAALLRALRLPPDTTHAASHKISSLLASRAAESCGVSAASPPSARAVAS